MWSTAFVSHAVPAFLVDGHALLLLPNLAFCFPLGFPLGLFHLLPGGGPSKLVLGLLVPSDLRFGGHVGIGKCGGMGEFGIGVGRGVS